MDLMLRARLEALERDAGLWDESALQARAEAGDWLRFVQGSLATRGDAAAAAMLPRMAELVARIEKTDEALFARFYMALKSGQLHGSCLCTYLEHFT